MIFIICIQLVDICGYGMMSGVNDFDFEVYVWHFIHDFLLLRLFLVLSALNVSKVDSWRMLTGSF